MSLSSHCRDSLYTALSLVMPIQLLHDDEWSTRYFGYWLISVRYSTIYNPQSLMHPIIHLSSTVYDTYSMMYNQYCIIYNHLGFIRNHLTSTIYNLSAQVPELFNSHSIVTRGNFHQHQHHIIILLLPLSTSHATIFFIFIVVTDNNQSTYGTKKRFLLIWGENDTVVPMQPSLQRYTDIMVKGNASW